MAKGAPAAAAPGWVVKTNWFAVAGPTTIGPETTLVKLLAVKSIVIGLAMVRERLVKLH